MPKDKVQPIKNETQLRQTLAKGPEYFKSNLYKSIVATIEDYYNIKSETKDMKKKLQKGIDPINTNTFDVATGKHPDMRADYHTNIYTLEHLKPLVNRLGTTDAGRDKIKAIKNIQQMSGVRKVLNQHPNYAKKLHLYSGQQVLHYMHHMVKSDREFGLYNEADTEQAVSNDVNPKGVYGDEVRNGNMDGEFTATPQDFKRRMHSYAKNGPKIQKAFKITHHSLNGKRINQKISKMIANNEKLVHKHAFSNAIKENKPKVDRKNVKTVHHKNINKRILQQKHNHGWHM